jgi:hypothetical protein
MTQAHPADPPLVSVGVPVYNGERYLPEALQALLEQTLQPIEIIISDNASTDGTAEICRSFASGDRRISYHRQPRNIGLAGNWNFVARSARGEYFKWASANDYVAPDFLAVCVGMLQQAPDAVLAFARTRLVGKDSVDLYDGDFPLIASDPIERVQTIWDQLRLNNAVSGVIRRTVLARTGLIRPYPGSDIVLMAELALQGKLLLAPQALFSRRVEPGAMSRHLSEIDLLRLHDPAARGDEWVTGRTHRDLLLVALSASGLTLGERSRLLAVALRRTLWARNAICAEITRSIATSLYLKRLDG